MQMGLKDVFGTILFLGILFGIGWGMKYIWDNRKPMTPQESAKQEEEFMMFYMLQQAQKAQRK